MQYGVKHVAEDNVDFPEFEVDKILDVKLSKTLYDEICRTLDGGK